MGQVGKAYEALSQVIQEGGARGKRLEEGQQGGGTSTELLQLEAEIRPLKGKLRRAEEARENKEEEIIKANLKNGKMRGKRKTSTDHRGSPTRNLPSLGFLDPKASSSLVRSEKLLPPRPIKTDVIIEGSPRQESSHKASPPRSFIPEVPTSTETVGNTQEAPSQGVQEGEALETRLEEGQQGGETSTELLQLKAEISPLPGKMREGEEAMEKHKEVWEAGEDMEAARQEISQEIRSPRGGKLAAEGARSKGR